MTRLVAVDADSSGMKVLLQRKLENERTQFQDQIVDWLVDDPEHVLIQMPTSKGTGVSRIDIYSGKVRKVERSRTGARRWISDGRGTPRLRQVRNEREKRWSYRRAGESEWRSLHQAKVTDLDDDYWPVGFGDDPSRLLVFKPKDGRLALWEDHLGNEISSDLIFSHPEVDVQFALVLGKFKRMVAVGYATDRGHLHYFDKQIERISRALEKSFPEQSIHVVDESWDRRYHLVHVGSDIEPGTYYRRDDRENKLEKLVMAYPRLDGRRLARMSAIRFEARDGTTIPGYLTKPPDAFDAPLPTIILPHGGPTARDYWGFDWIVQFLAAKGYAVLQANYRGSGGYGNAWAGAGGFRGWRLAIDDITDGLNHLVETGVADPQRVCIVGWSYGGYASLMSVLEEPDRYRCAVSIAGVTDPGRLITDAREYVGGRAVREFIGSDIDVLKAGSPLERTREFHRPALLFHGDKDINVRVEHSRKMASALKRAGKIVEYIEYEEVEHQIARDGYRIDMLDRIGSFLDRHIGETVGKQSNSGGEPTRIDPAP